MAASLCWNDEAQLRAAFNLALDGGVSEAMLREVVLTAYLFDGYPAALEGFRVLSSITAAPRTGLGVGYSPDEVSLWRKRGESLCRIIYGPQFERLTEHVLAIAPELADSMIVEGYGKVLSRDGLDSRLRELCVVAILAAKDRPRQLLSHCFGALRLGASESDLREALAAAAAVSPADNIAHSSAVLEDAFRRFDKS